MKYDHQNMKSLFEAFCVLRNEEEFDSFLKDLCTPKEIQELKERFFVAQKLYFEKKTYRTVHQECGASLVTITRVARFLRQEPYQGYKMVLERLINSSEKI